MCIPLFSVPREYDGDVHPIPSVAPSPLDYLSHCWLIGLCNGYRLPPLMCQFQILCLLC